MCLQKSQIAFVIKLPISLDFKYSLSPESPKMDENYHIEIIQSQGMRAFKIKAGTRDFIESEIFFLNIGDSKELNRRYMNEIIKDFMQSIETRLILKEFKNIQENACKSLNL